MAENEQTLQEWLDGAEHAIESGQMVEARRCLSRALRLDPNNEMAWLWLAVAVDTPDQRRDCLERVLQINPNNQVARSTLAELFPDSARSNYPPISAPRQGSAFGRSQVEAEPDDDDKQPRRSLIPRPTQQITPGRSETDLKPAEPQSSDVIPWKPAPITSKSETPARNPEVPARKPEPPPRKPEPAPKIETFFSQPTLSSGADLERALGATASQQDTHNDTGAKMRPEANLDELPIEERVRDIPIDFSVPEYEKSTFSIPNFKLPEINLNLDLPKLWPAITIGAAVLAGISLIILMITAGNWLSAWGDYRSMALNGVVVTGEVLAIDPPNPQTGQPITVSYSYPAIDANGNQSVQSGAQQLTLDDPSSLQPGTLLTVRYLPAQPGRSVLQMAFFAPDVGGTATQAGFWLFVLWASLAGSAGAGYAWRKRPVEAASGETISGVIIDRWAQKDASGKPHCYVLVQFTPPSEDGANKAQQFSQLVSVEKYRRALLGTPVEVELNSGLRKKPALALNSF